MESGCSTKSYADLGEGNNGTRTVGSTLVKSSRTERFLDQDAGIATPSEGTCARFRTREDADRIGKSYWRSSSRVIERISQTYSV